jgi:hypothetical protein
MMPTTMSSSRSVKAAAAVGDFSSIGLRRNTGGVIVKIRRQQPPDIDERHDVGWINNFYGNPGPKFPGNLFHNGTPWAPIESGVLGHCHGIEYPVVSAYSAVAKRRAGVIRESPFEGSRFMTGHTG